MFKILILFSFLFVLGCNSNLSKEEKESMWEKAQTEGEIINRSGTPFNLATNRKLALSDAENRLVTGGGLLGKNSLLSFGGDKDDDSNVKISSIGMPINAYLWRASLETINFMPLSSTDPMGGVIITDWYTSINNLNERCKLNIFINGADLKTDNLKVASFCQIKKEEQWVNLEPNLDDNIKLENTILNKAKKLKLNSG